MNVKILHVEYKIVIPLNFFVLHQIIRVKPNHNTNSWTDKRTFQNIFNTCIEFLMTHSFIESFIFSVNLHHHKMLSFIHDQHQFCNITWAVWEKEEDIRIEEPYIRFVQMSLKSFVCLTKNERNTWRRKSQIFISAILLLYFWSFVGLFMRNSCSSSSCHCPVYVYLYIILSITSWWHY